ncbi:uncharacterized protein FIESC28_02476 [Fusarium coffeatum]|uniref:CBM-cenC domain-containing protein n=1 Tax=Fusarium coffeatum TaxID=231269 RepID=A0A366S5V0_9HYPO|nr:uncharacterized protein FIESC28_02476 [Fusarium coffeatum]RBR24703.1 hypothetical protein FIESC28_02476 [Fusarium coffeatum]
MIAKTFVTAFIAASFMASSEASPCKVSSRTTDALTVGEISSTATATSTETAAATETLVSSSGVSSVETTALTAGQFDTTSEASTISDDATTTVAVATTDLTSIVVESTTEASITFEDATTTAVSTADLSSTVDESSIETSTVFMDATTTDTPTTEISPATTESTTTAEATTTTIEAPIVPTFLVNSGLDDESDTTQPWDFLFSTTSVSLSLSSTTKHEGRNSAKLTFMDEASIYVQQPLVSSIEAGVPYSASAWVRAGLGCTHAYLFCGYPNGNALEIQDVAVGGTADQWLLITNTCNYSRDQVMGGGLYLAVGFVCLPGSTAWFDSVSFEP